MRHQLRPAWALFFVVLFMGAAARRNFPQTSTGGSSAPQPTSATRSQTEASRAPDFQDDAWRVLWLGLKHPKTNQRVEAVKALSLAQGNRRAITFALRAFSDKQPRVRAAAAATLGELHATSSIPALKAALSDKEVAVVLAAAHALYVLKDPSAYEIYYAILMGDRKTSAGLIEAQMDRLKDPKQVIEIGVQEGMGFVPFGGMGYEAYRTLLKHDSSPVRATAARFLALDPDPISEDALIQTALVDKKSIVREAAVDALAQKGDPRCVERLAQNLHDKLYAVRYRTAAAIIHLSAAKPGRTSPN